MSDAGKRSSRIFRPGDGKWAWYLILVSIVLPIGLVSAAILRQRWLLATSSFMVADDGLASTRPATGSATGPTSRPATCSAS